MDTESDFAPWDLSKAHILVSTPVFSLDNDNWQLAVLKL